MTDFQFREGRPQWASQLSPWLTEVNHMFEGSGVNWQLTYGGDAYSLTAAGTLDDLAGRMEREAQCKSDVILGLTGQGDHRKSFSTYAFAHSVLVAVKPDDTQAIAALNIGRGLAAIFGTRSNNQTVISTDTLNGGPLDTADLTLIRELRHYDFAQGPAGLQGKWLKTATTAVAESLVGKVPNPMAEAHRTLGLALGSGRRHSDEISELREAVRNDPRNLVMRLDLGLALAADFDSPAAIEEFEKAAELDPSDPRPHIALGEVYLQAFRSEEAVEEYQSASRLDQHDARYLVALGQALTQQEGRAAEAMTAFRKAAGMGMGDVSKEAAALLETTESSVRQRLTDAKDQAQQSPSNADLHLKLGMAEMDSGNYDAALREFQRSSELDRKDGAAHIALARLYYIRGTFQEAASELNAARAVGREVPSSLASCIERKRSR